MTRSHWVTFLQQGSECVQLCLSIICYSMGIQRINPPPLFSLLLHSPPPLTPQITHPLKKATIPEISPDSLPFHSKNGSL